VSVVDRIFDLFAARGRDAYFGESVSQQEHALQAAHLAERSGASPALIAAALLHDIGHLIHGLPEDIAERGIDGRHEIAGQGWLANHFGPEVTEPVRMHVEAKRYLCRIDPVYRAGLSAASLQSLGLQGGILDEHEARRFESNPFFRDAVRLRRWDEEAKAPGLVVPKLDSYRELISGLLVSTQQE